MVKKSNLGSFYNFVNNRLNRTHKIESIIRADGTLTDESLEQADIFDHFFGSVFTIDMDLMLRSNGVINSILNTLSVEELIRKSCAVKHVNRWTKNNMRVLL